MDLLKNIYIYLIRTFHNYCWYKINSAPNVSPFGEFCCFESNICYLSYVICEFLPSKNTRCMTLLYARVCPCTETNSNVESP